MPIDTAWPPLQAHIGVAGDEKMLPAKFVLNILMAQSALVPVQTGINLVAILSSVLVIVTRIVKLNNGRLIHQCAETNKNSGNRKVKKMRRMHDDFGQ